MPAQPVVSVDGRNRSLLVTWTYDNPPLSEAVIDGYRVYRDGVMVVDVPATQRQFIVDSLDPFTNYTVEVLAYNRINGEVQLGPRSEPVTEETLQDCMLILLLHSQFTCVYTTYIHINSSILLQLLVPL